MKVNDLPDLSRTAAAIDAYDVLQDLFSTAVVRASIETGQKLLDALDRADEAVGIAYGLDTADRNNQQTCRDCIRAGLKVPAHPDDLSLVRRMVAEWKAAQEKR